MKEQPALNISINTHPCLIFPFHPSHIPSLPLSLPLSFSGNTLNGIVLVQALFSLSAVTHTLTNTWPNTHTLTHRRCRTPRSIFPGLEGATQHQPDARVQMTSSGPSSWVLPHLLPSIHTHSLMHPSCPLTCYKHQAILLLVDHHIGKSNQSINHQSISQHPPGWEIILSSPLLSSPLLSSPLLSSRECIVRML